jgi:hypothetical protein
MIKIPVSNGPQLQSKPFGTANAIEDEIVRKDNIQSSASNFTAYFSI